MQVESRITLYDVISFSVSSYSLVVLKNFLKYEIRVSDGLVFL